jgi:hypothetical protein
MLIAGLLTQFINVAMNLDATSLLFAAVLLSIIPIGLVVLDIVLQQGAVVEYKGVRLGLARDADA